MSRTMVIVIAFAAVLFGVAAAGTIGALMDDGDGGSSAVADTSSPSPESSPTEAASATSTVTVQLRDDRPLNAMFNDDGVNCTTEDLGELLLLSTQNPNLSYRELRISLPKTTVKLTDANGATVGVETLKAKVGFFRQKGCSHSVTFFDVPQSDFYTVTIAHGDFEKVLDLDGGEGDVVLEASF